MENKYKKIIISLGIVWSLIWIYLIFTRYSKQSLYLFISEFAVVFSMFILSSVLIQIKDSKKEVLRFLGVAIVLGALFGIPIYMLSKSFLVLIYFGLSILFNLINFYFLKLEEKISSFKPLAKDMIFLILSGVIGVGVLSIIVYHLFKVLERILELFGIELIKFGHKK